MKQRRRTKAEIKEWYRHWYMGDLSYLNRPDGQARLDRTINEIVAANPGSARPIVAECHRRLGKSFWGIRRGWEKALKKPGAICRIGAPTKEMAKDIVEQDLNDLLADCPPDFPYRKVGQKWYVKNPKWRDSKVESLVHIVGCDYKRGNLLRGTGADFIFLDEAGYIESLEYIMRHIIAPQFDRTDHPEYFIFSTPSEHMDHYFMRPGGVIETAIRFDRHILIPGSKNSDFNAKEKRKFLEAANTTEDSIEYQREIECLHVSDEQKLVVPEYLRHREAIEQPVRRPDWFIPWIGMDTGYTDYTAILFSFVDFKEARLCIEDMIWVHYKSLGDLAGLIWEKMHELYDEAPTVYGQPMIDMVRMVADCPELDLETLNQNFPERDDQGSVIHSLTFESVEKYGREAAIAAFRSAIQEDRIRINKRRCGALTYQLENALWNESRTDFRRTKNMGHCDALITAVYLWRMVILDENPYPDRQYSPDREWVLDVQKGDQEAQTDGILSAFGLADEDVTLN